MNKTVLIENISDKFIDNVKLSDTDHICNKIVLNTKKQLYEIYYRLKFDIFIVPLSTIDNEAIQFIKEFSNNDVTIYLYLDILDNYSGIINNLNTQKINIIYNYWDDINTQETKNKYIKIPKLVNPELFYKKQIEKNDSIVSFMDNTDILPDALIKYLYPASTTPIKLFNNSNIIHPQNLGIISEEDKAELLQTSRYYLAITEQYIPEAWACGCEVLAIEDLPSMKASKYKNEKFYQSYVNFMKGLLSEKN